MRPHVPLPRTVRTVVPPSFLSWFLEKKRKRKKEIGPGFNRPHRPQWLGRSPPKPPALPILPTSRRQRLALVGSLPSARVVSPKHSRYADPFYALNRVKVSGVLCITTA